MHHDVEGSEQVRGKEPPGSYSRNVSYGNATEQHLVRLIDSMFSCQQFVRWDCKGAMFGFWYPPGLDSWYVTRNITSYLFLRNSGLESCAPRATTLDGLHGLGNSCS